MYNKIKKHLLEHGECKVIGNGIYYCSPKDEYERLTLVYLPDIEYIFFDGHIYISKLPSDVYAQIKMYLLDC